LVKRKKISKLINNESDFWPYYHYYSPALYVSLSQVLSLQEEVEQLQPALKQQQHLTVQVQADQATELAKVNLIA